MTDYADLLERLRASRNSVRRQSADAIERLTREKDDHERRADTNQLRADKQEDRAEAAEARVKVLEERKDAAYEERNRVVALLASLYPATRCKTAIYNWSEDWHGCVYITLPTGQVSWHYHDSHAHLFAHVPEVPTEWDGHTTEEKYKRVARAALKGE